MTFSVMKSTGDEYFTEVRNLAFLVQILSLMLIINDVQKKNERQDKINIIYLIVTLDHSIVILYDYCTA